VDTSTLAVVGTLNLAISFGFSKVQITEVGGQFFLIGPDALSSSAVTTIEFNPTTMAQIASTAYATSSALGAVYGSTVTGGFIYFTSSASPTAAKIHKLNPTTRALDASYTVPTHTTIRGLDNDGTNIYALVQTAGSQQRIHKITTAFAFVLESGDLELNIGVGNGISYDSGTTGVYIIKAGGITKINPSTLAFVSTQTSQSLVGSELHNDGTYIYATDNNNVYSRETLADF
jgi:hypothetical protein